MARRKLTGFARFFIVMLFVVPLAYIGASYYNGQDPFKNAGDLLNKFRSSTTTTETAPENTTSVPSGEIDLQIKNLEERIKELEQENTELRAQIRQMDVQIKELHRQRK